MSKIPAPYRALQEEMAARHRRDECTIAQLRARNTELERKLAMLVDTLEKLSHLGMNDMHPYKQMIDSSLSATKPTADAFVARIKATVKEEDAAILKEYVPDFVWEQLPADSAAKQAIGRLLNDAAELRNAKKEV